MLSKNSRKAIGNFIGIYTEMVYEQDLRFNNLVGLRYPKGDYIQIEYDVRRTKIESKPDEDLCKDSTTGKVKKSYW